MPVSKFGFAEVASIVSWPATVTETLPLFPEPKVLLEISPLVLMRDVPALTVRLPPVPDPEVLLDMLPGWKSSKSRQW
jgi:hypothetical protein